MEGCDYEVFLSFRGPDTRTGFTDHLYTRLTDAGVCTYRDGEDLHIGEEIGPDLLGAIEQSKISIPIFSRSYASSKWCLKELAQMVECRKRKGQVIMPIFYYVEPSEVRYQTGGYGEALLVHENKKRVDDETIRKWRAALNEVGGLKGWNTANVANGHEGQLVKEVITKVLSELKKVYLVVSDFLVGVDDSVKEVLGRIGTDTNDRKILGIHGMGGIGKTTLAKMVYNELSQDFVDCCFLADVRETSHSKGIVCLQTQLISDLSNQAHQSINSKDEGIMTIEERFSRKKVLILLDDVDEKDQLTALLGRRSCFGPGSRILITTRKVNVLREFGVKLTYFVGGLDPERSLQLFSKHVFRRDHPPIEKMEQSREIVKIAEGLPLILEVMGSTLSICGQTEEMWEDYLVKWKKGHINNFRSKLMISYETLDPSQREIFLDIACLFDGYDKSTVIYMWRDCGLCPTEGLEVLQLMSLIKIGEDNKLWMHDQLKDLGREIISQESGGELDKQSRLWNHKDALEIVLREKKNAKLEALCLKFEKWSEYRFTLEGFAALPNLRFLQVDSQPLVYDRVDRFFSQATLLWHNKSLIVSPTYFSLSENQLLPNLRWLSWHNFPQWILKISYFSLSNLVILDFSRSKITHDWNGWRHIKRAEKLKVLDLSECRHLIRTPDFSGLLTLERLILESCRYLAKIDSSIGQLKRLVFLNLRSCISLHYLPKELGGLSSLRELLLHHTNISEIPDWWGIENLENPHEQISPSEVGDSLNCLTSLLTLSLDGTDITHLPNSIGVLTNLESLSLSGCFYMHTLPYSIKELRSLTELDLFGTSLTELPDSMESLENLKALKLCLFQESVVPPLPKLPESLTSLAIVSDVPIADPDLSNLINLKLLLFIIAVPAISGRPKLVQVPAPWWIGRLSKLEVLTLGHPSITDLSPELGALPRLKTLQLFDCCSLECIPQIPSSVTKLHIGKCSSLTTLDISYLKNLAELYVLGSSIEDLSRREPSNNLQEWKISEDWGADLEQNFLKMMWKQHGLTTIMYWTRFNDSIKARHTIRI
ncbi:disease resistance protein RUN1-like [Syzygium oleosum]|uniref:disease resistance protein RUN1-like n=1 Tax=Syzygium oleosum TaxID=219896 RepID=UPI0024BA563D|nr:disease resistance protein RUN1-like [Syzygium oleosum]